MKKLTSLILLCSTLFLFTACGTQEAAQNEVGDAPINNSQAVENKEENTEDSPLAEFSILINDQRLQLGQQQGEFPWGSGLRMADAEYSSEDGFDTFVITCADGSILDGLRAEGMENETDATLLGISTDNPTLQTYRGAYIGMTLEEFKELYPEAVYRENTDDDSYTYSNEAGGFSQIVFWFENQTLSSFKIVNGIDGFLY